ncbi:MAG: Uncharacterised protein [Owenweeksia sp. TMED14]|nr:MAG: Uncharacterised protein [Owenweeksia sp. TMED14]|tara:strand:- start:5980 stop:6273 length:294 start_codon:yes stop_codon:yes gene_type:complete
MIQNSLGFNKGFNLKNRIPNVLIKIAIFAFATYFIKEDFPFVKVIFWIYASLNVFMLIGFWVFTRFLKKKMGQVNNQFQGNNPPQDEDLGEAEVIED